MGTVTDALEVGAVVVTVGLVGESGVAVEVGAGVGLITGLTGPTIGVIGLMIGVASASGRFSLVLSEGPFFSPWWYAFSLSWLHQRPLI